MITDMQVAVESVGLLGRRLNVVVPFAQLEQMRKQKLAELGKKAVIDGFRPGKVPVRVIERFYGGSVWEEVIQKFLQTSLFAALEQNSLSPAGEPSIDSIKAEPGNDLEYTAIFEVYPQVSVSSLKGVTLEKLQVNITEADVDLVLEQVRYQHADWIEVPRKAQHGDKVCFDIIFSEKEIKKDITLILKESDIPKGEVPKGLSVLFGSTVGEVLSTLFINDEKASASDQVIAAMITVKKVAEPRLAELDDAFANRLGVQEEGGMEALRIQIRQFMQADLDRTLRERLKKQVIEQLLAKNSIDTLPQILLDREFQHLKSVLQEQARRQSSNTTTEPLPEGTIKELQQEAERRVKFGLLCDTIIKQRQLQMDESRVQQKIEQLGNFYQQEQVVRDKIYSDKNILRGLHAQVLEDQVIDELLQQVEFIERSADYVEVMGFDQKIKVKCMEEVIA